MALFFMSDNLNSLYKCRIVQEVVVVGLGVRKEIGTVHLIALAPHRG